MSPKASSSKLHNSKTSTKHEEEESKGTKVEHRKRDKNFDLDADDAQVRDEAAQRKDREEKKQTGKLLKEPKGDEIKSVKGRENVRNQFPNGVLGDEMDNEADKTRPKKVVHRGKKPADDAGDEDDEVTLNGEDEAEKKKGKKTQKRIGKMHVANPDEEEEDEEQQQDGEDDNETLVGRDDKGRKGDKKMKSKKTFHIANPDPEEDEEEEEPADKEPEEEAQDGEQDEEEQPEEGEGEDEEEEEEEEEEAEEEEEEEGEEEEGEGEDEEPEAEEGPEEEDEDVQPGEAITNDDEDDSPGRLPIKQSGRERIQDGRNGGKNFHYPSK